RQLGGERALLVLELELLDQAGNARWRVGDAVHAPDETQVLFDSEILEELRLIGDEREAALRLDGLAGELVTSDGDASARWRDDARERAEGRCLPRPVRSDEAEYLAWRDGERE